MPTTLHDPGKVLSELEQLRRSAIVPTLGELYRSLKRDRAGVMSDKQRTEIAECYDEVFGDRPDYAIWRREFANENATAISAAFPKTETLLQDGFFYCEPTVVWGVLSLANALATSTRG